MKTKSKSKKAKICKIATVMNTILSTFATAMISTSAANNAPPGVDQSAYTTVVNIVYWIVVAAIGAASLPGIQGIVKGQTDDDMRQRNSGIVSVVVAGCCVGAATAIKTICF